MLWLTVSEDSTRHSGECLMGFLGSEDTRRAFFTWWQTRGQRKWSKTRDVCSILSTALGCYWITGLSSFAVSSFLPPYFFLLSDPPPLCPCCLFLSSLFLSLPPFFQCWEFNQVLAPFHDRWGLSYRAVLSAPFQYPYLESQGTLLSLSPGCWALVFGHLQLLSGHGHPWPLNEESREGESHTVSLFQDSLGVSQALLKP